MRLARGAHDRLLVDRLERAHVDEAHARGPAILEERRARARPRASSEAVGEEGDVASPSAEHLGASDLERRVLRRPRRPRVVADVAGARLASIAGSSCDELLARRPGRTPACRDAAHQRDVLDGLVRGAVAVGEEAGNAADELDRQAADADVGADELERAQGEERGERVTRSGCGPRRASPAAAPIIVCSAMPTSMKRGPSSAGRLRMAARFSAVMHDHAVVGRGDRSSASCP